MKKMLSLLLCAVLLLSMSATASAAETNAVVWPFEYEVLEDGTLRITQYTETFNDEYDASVVWIPSVIDGRYVTEIGNSAFLRAFYIDTVIIADTVNKIGVAAFQESNVRQVFLPEGLETIERQAFFNCHELETIVIPSTVETIGEHALGFYWYCDPAEPNLVPGSVGVNPRVTMVADHNAAVTAYAAQTGVNLVEFDDCTAGDTNLDGTLDTRDIRTTLHYLMYSDMLDYWRAGDFNGDGRFDTVDARESLRDLLTEKVDFEVEYITTSSSIYQNGTNPPWVVTNRAEWDAFTSADTTSPAVNFFEHRPYDDAFFAEYSLIILYTCAENIAVDAVVADAQTVTVETSYMAASGVMYIEHSTFVIVSVKKAVLAGKSVRQLMDNVYETSTIFETSTKVMVDFASSREIRNNTGKYEYQNGIALQSTADVAAFLDEHQAYTLDENGESVLVYKEFHEDDFADYDEAFFEDNVLIVSIVVADRFTIEDALFDHMMVNDKIVLIDCLLKCYPNSGATDRYARNIALIPLPRELYSNQVIETCVSLRFMQTPA